MRIAIVVFAMGMGVLLSACEETTKENPSPAQTPTNTNTVSTTSATSPVEEAPRTSYVGGPWSDKSVSIPNNLTIKTGLRVQKIIKDGSYLSLAKVTLYTNINRQLVPNGTTAAPVVFAVDHGVVARILSMNSNTATAGYLTDMDQLYKQARLGNPDAQHRLIDMWKAPPGPRVIGDLVGDARVLELYTQPSFAEATTNLRVWDAVMRGLPRPDAHADTSSSASGTSIEVF